MDQYTELSTLEEKLNCTFKELNISYLPKFLSNILGLIKNKDYDTYTHLIRVSLLGEKVGKLINSYDIIDFKTKDFFLACLLHDTGKLYRKSESLCKIKGFNKQDMEDMKKHPVDGYYLLKQISYVQDKDIFDFSAEITLRHHRYKKEEPYPENIQGYEKNKTRKTKEELEFYSKVLSIVDFYDSLKNRRNDRYSKKNIFGEIKLLKSEKAKKIILSNFPEDWDFIDELYDQEIFK